MGAEHSNQVVVPATARNRSKLFGFVGQNNLEDESGVVVQPSGQGQIERNLPNSVESLEIRKEFLHLVKNGGKFLPILSENFLRSDFFEQFDWRPSVFGQFSDDICLLFSDTFLLDQFFFDLGPWLFIQLINRAANRLETLRVASCFMNDTLQYFSVVHFD